MPTYSYTFPKTCYKAGSPTVNDDSTKGYIVNTLLINTITDERYVCIDSAAGAAVWIKDIDFINPTEDTLPSAQAKIDANNALRSITVTPQIYYQDSIIDYDIEVPGNALSAGPITVSVGSTVTVGLSGCWTVI